ncbi:uncharacterized protein BO80DRAFT_504925 [Aspergillus ibericus CBS 121593]|uniref:Condensation domain-containing protein n=1 Tax=Aspergillus ibericus CBS 121593 TaxID=1448316 RepID=A0A395GNN2_9EURO|nr:hypothetical protein BO80DRAFT_504925 [Aspergillus ibericus CBS 121593]RAK97089.1 hypothetical protein BO80DRAFT_504925 [Aspergillus ibericus CBS 121593]
MSWSQVSPTRWERPLTGFEEYLVHFANISTTVSTTNQQYTTYSKVSVDINLPNITTALQHAWKQMRFEEPDMAATIEGTTKIYEIPNEQTLHEWLDSTFIVTDLTDADALQRNGTYITQSKLYYLPHTSELVLRAQHYTIDGVGVLIWWDKFFRALLNPNPDIVFGDEHHCLSVPLPEALGNNDPPTEAETKKATAQVLQYVAGLPSIGMVSKAGQVPPGKSQHIEYRFSPDLTAAIIHGCKRTGISVTSAVHAAYGMVLMQHADPNSNTSQYTTVQSFNLRDYLPERYRTVAAANYPTTVPFSITLPVGFDQFARALNQSYRYGIKENCDALNIVGAYNKVLIGMLKSPEAQDMPGPTDAYVSSLGIVERYLRRSYGGVVRVKDYEFAVDVVLGLNALHVFSFRDELRLVYSFNDGFEEPGMIREYLEGVERVLREVLGFLYIQF